MEKKKSKKNNNGIFYVVISLLAVLGIGLGVYAYVDSQSVNVQGDYNFYEAGTVFPDDKAQDNLGALPGQFFPMDETDFNGVKQYTVSGRCTNGTTTPIAIKNPFSATSTVVFAQVNFVNATSTFDVDMGVSTTAFRDGAGDGLIDGLALATSSQVSIVNGDTNAGTNSKANILVDPTEYITAKFTPREATKETSLYENGNTFDCTYSVVFMK